MCLFFGTPIGNRTLVSAVRGRRLEPLDHEGKSLLLCDNSIIYCRMQAKKYIFSQNPSLFPHRYAFFKISCLF